MAFIRPVWKIIKGAEFQSDARIFLQQIDLFAYLHAMNIYKKLTILNFKTIVERHDVRIAILVVHRDIHMMKILQHCLNQYWIKHFPFKMNPFFLPSFSLISFLVSRSTCPQANSR